MPGLVPGIHVFFAVTKDVDGRDEPGHDEKTLCECRQTPASAITM